MIEEFMALDNTPFFVPTDNFWSALSKIPWRWKKYHDCGAGSGHLTKAMREHGFSVDAYDLYPRDKPAVSDIKICDVTDDCWWDINAGEVMLFARPCHDGFVNTTVRKNLGNFCEALYISLPRNIERDVGDFTLETLATDVGEVGEVMLRILATDKAKHFRKVRVDGSNTANWWEWTGSRYKNAMGGGFSESDTKVEIVDAVNLEHCEMLYLDKAANSDELRSGWIAPDGEWFGCGYSEHGQVLRDVIGIYGAQAEKVGFIKCYGDYETGDVWSWSGPEGMQVTKDQIKTLRRKGYKYKNRMLVSDKNY